MVPSPPSEESSPAVAAEIQRLNRALAAGSTPSTASSDPGPASAFSSQTRKMLTRKPTPRGLGSGGRVASSNADDDASTPSKVRSLSLKREIDATTPAREVVHRIVSAEEPKGKDAESARRSFVDDTAARVSVDSPLSFSRELLEKERTAEKDLSAEKVVPSRVREYETAESRAALELLEKKLSEVERDLQKARREAAETAKRAAAVERTNARLRRELLETTASRRSEIQAGSGKSVHEPPLVDETVRQKQNPDPAALYVDVERLSAELRETKRRLAEANAAAAAADAENKKVFDEMLAAANEVADDLERERARCERAECELGQARAAALAHDESRLGEIIEVKSELALAKASLRVAKEKNAGVLVRLDVASEKREGPEDESPEDAPLLRDLRLERERLRFELGEARSAAAAAEARASKACSSAAGARAAAALAEAATEAVEARRDSVETKLREDLREARRKLHRATGEGDGDDAGEEDDVVSSTTSSTRAARDAVARREKEAASRVGGVGGFPARLTAVLMFALASVLILAFAGLLLVAMSDRRRDARGYECAARWMRASFVDELLSGTLGAPFRRDDVCHVAAPPAT